MKAPRGDGARCGGPAQSAHTPSGDRQRPTPAADDEGPARRERPRQVTSVFALSMGMPFGYKPGMQTMSTGRCRRAWARVVAGCLWLLALSPAWPAPTPARDAQVATDPAAAFAWPAALEAAGQRNDAAMLRRALIDRWLRLLEGGPGALQGSPATMQQLIEAGGRTPPEAEQTRRWQALLRRHLVLAPSPPGLAVPPELEADSARLTTLAPGLWLQQGPDGTARAAWWWVLLRHDAPAVLALGDFDLETRAATAPALRWRCALPRYAERRVLPPGTPEPFLCHMTGSELVGRPALEDHARRLAGPTPPALQVTVASTALAAAVRRLEAAALPAVAPAATADAQRAAPAAQPAASARQRHAARGANGTPPEPPTPVWLTVLKALAVAASALGVYTVLHRIGGGGFAFFVTWLGGTGLTLAAAYKTMPGLRDGLAAGSHASAVLPGLGWAMALVVPLLATAALAVVHTLLFGPREVVIQAMQRTLADSLLDAFRRRLDRLLRR